LRHCENLAQENVLQVHGQPVRGGEHDQSQSEQPGKGDPYRGFFADANSLDQAADEQGHDNGHRNRAGKRAESQHESRHHTRQHRVRQRVAHEAQTSGHHVDAQHWTHHTHQQGHDQRSLHETVR